MPHQCVNCGNLYNNVSDEILKGCKWCGRKLFFFIKAEKMPGLRSKVASLSEEDKQQIEQDVYDILGADANEDYPVILDVESVNILGPGKYEIDLVNLFKKKHPVIVKLEDGKYFIDLPESFRKFMG